MRPQDSGATTWLPAILLVAGLIAGLLGLLAGAYLFPRTLVVEKPVEVVVEKRVEVPVEKTVFVEKRVELPPAPYSYQPEAGGRVTVGSDDLRVALLMRDAIRKAGDEPKISYDSEALFPPTKSLKILVSPNPAVGSSLSREAVRAAVAATFEARGFKVLDDDSTDADWNTLVHVEIDAVLLPSRGMAGRVSVSLRQGMLAYSNLVWRKVNIPVVAFSEVRHFGTDPSAVVLSAVKVQSERAAVDLAARKSR